MLSIAKESIYMLGNHKTTSATITDTNSNRILIVTYHNTAVVKLINDRYAVLNSGGYRTNTTKRRMNQASLQYALGFEVYQVNFVWYVSIGNEVCEYYDGIVIDTKKDKISAELLEHPDIN